MPAVYQTALVTHTEVYKKFTTGLEAAEAAAHKDKVS